MNYNSPVLTPRLKTIAALIKPCNLIADIGTDHAYLPVYLCMTDKCKYAVASDIRKGPLERAASTINRYSVSDRVKTRLGSGAETLNPNEADCIVVAGMGGLVISEIMKSSAEVFDTAKQIILQPMTAADELRSFLNDNDYTIIGEYLAKEDEKIYNIIEVSPGKDVKYSAPELYIGKKLIETQPEHFKEYLKKRKTRLEKMINGLKLSSNSEAKKDLPYLSDILSFINQEELK